MDGVRPLADGGLLASAREQSLKQQIETASLPLHQLQIVENARETVVSATTGMEDVPRRNTNRQAPRVHDLESIGVEVEVCIAALRIGSMDEGVDQKLSDNGFFEGRHLGAQHSVGHLVTFAEVGNLVPNGVEQLDGRQLVIIPAPLRYLRGALVVLDRLYDRRAAEARPVASAAYE